MVRSRARPAPQQLGGLPEARSLQILLEDDRDNGVEHKLDVARVDGSGDVREDGPV